jgi:hypothetical protein
MPATRAFERRRILRQNPFVDSIAGLTACALDLDHRIRTSFSSQLR